MDFLSRYFLSSIKRLRFKWIVIIYIVGSLLWGLIQHQDEMDLSAFKPFTMQDIQNVKDITGTHLQEKKAIKSTIKQQLQEDEPVVERRSNILLDNTTVFQGMALVTSGVTFKLSTPVAQSWRKHVTRNIHLYGVDTCAPRQRAKLNDQEWPCGVLTMAWLVTKTLGRSLSCKQVVVQNGVSYAQCFVDDIDLAEEGLAEGMLVLAKESKDPLPVQYRHAEEVARNNKIGLWSSDFTEPAKWRRDNGSYNPFAGL